MKATEIARVRLEEKEKHQREVQHVRKQVFRNLQCEDNQSRDILQVTLTQDMCLLIDVLR